MTFQRFSYFLVLVSLVGSVITATQLSQAYQLNVTAPGQETISGRILSINQETGIIMVETATGTVQLEAAPEAIAGWKEGDPVVVKIGATEPREQEKVVESKKPLP